VLRRAIGTVPAPAPIARPPARGERRR